MNNGNRFTEEYIKRHINFYTSEAVASRGRQLYKNDKVFFDDYIEKTDSWKFTVLGSKKYQVLVKGTNSQNIQTSCTCPFDWGSICKHAVAALLFVSDNLGDQLSLQYQKNTQIKIPVNYTQRKNLGFEIPGYQHIDLDFIKRNTSANVFSALFYQGNYILYDSLDITNESVTFSTKNANANVKFYMEDGKVYVTSPQAAKSAKLSSSEAHCLYLIAKSPMPHFLDDVFSGKVLDSQKEKINRFGLPENTKFNEYFTYIFTEQQGLMFYPSKKGEGLIPVNEDNKDYISVWLEKLNNNELLLAEISKKKERRELGFV